MRSHFTKDFFDAFLDSEALFFDLVLLFPIAFNSDNNLVFSDYSSCYVAKAVRSKIIPSNYESFRAC